MPTLPGIPVPAHIDAPRSSGRYRLAAGSHARDSLSTCPSCGNVCAQRYDATQAIERDGEMWAAHQMTCSGCGQTYFTGYVARPDLTFADNLTVLERREPSAEDLRTRIAIADMFAENARCRGDYSTATTQAREAFEARRALFKIERLCGTETDGADVVRGLETA